MTNITFTAPPTVAKFMQSEAFGRIIAGPVGSGKTTGCIFELFRRACEQEKSPDGFRYTRFAILRQTLKQLKDTVLKDILDERNLGGLASYKVSDNTVYIDIGDVKSEWLLIPLEDPEDQRRLLSMQLTGAWISEAIEINVSLLSAVTGRIGRFPGASLGGATWFGMIADTNMPVEGSDWWKFMETDTPSDWQVFIQPGGLEENAENLENLLQTPETLKLSVDDPEGLARRRAQGRTYYERFARSNTDSWVQRYVHAKYGNDPSGTAVYRESFKMAFHVVDELEPVATLPLLVGQDFGRDPCSLICQVDHRGRLLVLEEVLAEDIGLELHVQQALRPTLMGTRYLGKAVAVIGDPAGRAKSSIHEETSFDALKRLGFSAFAAPTNNIDPRIRAVEAFLLASRGGGPAMMIDRKRCPTLVRALAGGYRYDRTKAGQRKPAPSKNNFSHIADAHQYVCLVAHGGMTELMARHLQRRSRSSRQRVSAAAWT